MKKRLMILSTAVLLFSGLAFASAGGDKDKGKDKNKKPQSGCTKGCPGKECGKKKDTSKS